MFEVILFGMGAASTCAAFAVIVWRIAKPHVARYVEALVRPIAEQVTAVLTNTALAIGLDPAEVRRTLASARAAGLANPRGVPIDPHGRRTP